jgi:hypothetical protein
MSLLFKYNTAILLLCTFTTIAQDNNKERYRLHFTGCWQSGDARDGDLITNADASFVWIKPSDIIPGKTDTLSGRWKTKGVYNFPFKTDVIILHPNKGRNKRYEIGTTSMPATIYLGDGRKMNKVDCNAR